MERVVLNPTKQKLLISRTNAARKLNCSWITLYRLQRAGKLKAVRLSSSPVGKVFYSVEAIEALAEHGVQ